MIKDISEFIFHDEETKNKVMILVNCSALFPAERRGIIFYGNYGCGKTTLARLMPDAIDKARGSAFEFGLDLELACSAGDYRQQLKDVRNALSGPIFRPSAVKFVLFDEFDNYKDKQVTFKSLLTNPHIGFFITTNDLSKISPSIQSRCHLVELKEPPAAFWQSYAHNMFAQRNVPVTSAEIQNAISAARTYSQRQMIVALETLLYIKQQEKSAA